VFYLKPEEFTELFMTVGNANYIYGLQGLLEFIRNIMASISYILHLIAVARREVSFSNTSPKPSKCSLL
jgi:hypothetical protein